MSVRGHDDQGAGASDSTHAWSRPSREAALRGLQGLVGLWLMLMPTVLPGPPRLIDMKDLLGGTLLAGVAIAAVRAPRARALEPGAGLLVGVVLIIASIGLNFGSGPDAAARQWSEVIVGVLLVCLWAARAR